MKDYRGGFVFAKDFNNSETMVNLAKKNERWKYCKLGLPNLGTQLLAKSPFLYKIN